MINIEVNELCCGCGLCEIQCPQKCISMVFDKEGFRKAKIDLTRCKKCGVCKNICILRNPECKNAPIKVYGAWHIDEKVREVSSSGGMFTAIAERAFSCGMPIWAIEEDIYGLRFKKASCCDDITNMHGSKYYQGFVDEILLEDIKNQKRGG